MLRFSFSLALQILTLFTLVWLTDARPTKRRKKPLPPQPRVSQDVPRPAEFEQISDAQIRLATGPEAAFREKDSVRTEDYLRCVHHMSRIIDPIHRVFHNYGRVDPNDGTSPDGLSTASTGATEFVSPLPEWCRFHWIPRHQLFAGLDSIVFLGDSVLLRAFHDVFMVPNEIYFQKIVSIDGLLNGTIVLRGGRVVKVFFFRNQFAATFPHTLSQILDPANGMVTSRSLVVSTLGMHDTRWLIFRQQPPGYRKGQLGSWSYARRYWSKHAGAGFDAVDSLIQDFQNKSTSSGFSFSSPFIVFRDPVPPSCSHPKYANRPQITRCDDLLAPIVIPWYRDTALAAGGLMGIPTVTMDSAMPPCGLIDAGHLYRWCKEAELQMLIQAYRLGRRLGIVQGRRTVSPNTSKGSFILALNNVTLINEANAVFTAPYMHVMPRRGDTVSLPTVGMGVSAHQRLNGQPYFRIRFDGVAPPVPTWQPSVRRIEIIPSLINSNNNTMPLPSSPLAVWSIPSQTHGTLGKLVQTFEDPTVVVNEEAVDLYYHSPRSETFLQATLVKVLSGAPAPEPSNETAAEALEPWSRASYFQQPSLTRWGYYYQRNISSASTVETAAVAVPESATSTSVRDNSTTVFFPTNANINTEGSLSNNITPSEDPSQELEALVSAMVQRNINNETSRKSEISTPSSSSTGGSGGGGAPPPLWNPEITSPVKSFDEEKHVQSVTEEDVDDTELSISILFVRSNQSSAGSGRLEVGKFSDHFAFTPELASLILGSAVLVFTVRRVYVGWVTAAREG